MTKSIRHSIKHRKCKFKSKRMGVLAIVTIISAAFIGLCAFFSNIKIFSPAPSLIASIAISILISLCCCFFVVIPIVVCFLCPLLPEE